MLDIKNIQDNPAELEEILRRRRYRGVDIDSLKTDLERSRTLRFKIDEGRAERNAASKEIGALMAQKKNAEADKRKVEVKHLGEAISALEKEFNELQEQLGQTLLGLPNRIEEDVPDGDDESANVVLRKEGSPPEFDFKPRTHWEMGELTGILDFERGVRMSGSRFYSYRGLAARLERALISFMLDLHTSKSGYTEIWTPSLVDDEAMTVTGQYPKFKGEFYRLDDDGLSLIPTSEVPLVNLYRGEIIPEEELPLALTAASSCYRREAGAAGRDTRGLVRVHQFQKVELVQFVHPERSREIHEQMREHAEEVLKRLGLHYRVLLLCSGDMGATAAKTYDLEVWMPGLNRFLEISSISNCLDYQARRGMIRFRPAGPKKKPELVHTLNGSGLAAGRTLIAIMENYQREDGTFDIPEALREYLRV